MNLRRVFSVSAIVAGLIAAIVVAAPFLVSSDLARSRIEAQITEWTGLEVALRGEPAVALFPYLTVKLKDVRIGAGQDGRPPLVRMDVLKASLKLMPLLFGRIEVAEFTLQQPQFHLVVDETGKDNWDLDRGSVGRGLSTAAETGPAGSLDQIAEVKLANLTIVGGRFSFEDRGRGRSETVANVNLKIEWPAINAAGSAVGTGEWRGEMVEANIAASAPLAFVSGQQTDLRMSIASKPLRFSFDGQANRLADLQLEGDLTVSAPSVRRVVEWTGKEIGPGSTLGPLSITAELNAVGWTASLREAAIELDGNRAEGVLAVGLGGERPSLQGTLALETLDLSPYSELWAGALKRADLPWQEQAVPAGALDAVDLDLRVSAGRVLIGQAKFGRTALSAVVKDRHLTVDIGETILYGGRGDGTLKLKGTDDGLSGRLLVNLADVRLEAGLPDLIGSNAVEGAATIKGEVAFAGANYGAVVGSLNGQAAVTIASGAINGIDIGQLAQASYGPERPADTPIGGRTRFDIAAATLTIVDGVAASDDFKFSSPQLDVTLTGKSVLKDQSLDLRGMADIYEERGLIADNRGKLLVELPFFLKGRWSQPLLVPDVSRLIGGGAK